MSVVHKLPAQVRKAAIVEAAIKLFSEKGFRGATTRELAAAVGVSEPVLYQHFATKSDLYAAIIDTKSQDVRSLTEGLASYIEVGDDRAFLTHLADVILDFFEHDPGYLRLLLFSSLERHELADRFHERQARGFLQAVIGYIERRVEQGAFREGIDPNLIAMSFIGMVAHYGQDHVLSELKDWPQDRKVVVDGMVSIFLNGVRKTS
jgi:TetR/AcrR family transcriptional regulator